MGIPLKNLHLRLTAQCNKACHYCYASASLEEKPSPFPASYWSNLVRAAIPLGLQSVTLTGGEPTIYHGFDQLVCQLESLPIHFSIETNGLTLKGKSDILLGVKNLKKVFVGLYFPNGSSNGNHSSVDNLITASKRGIPAAAQITVLQENIPQVNHWVPILLNQNIPVRLILGHNKLGRAKHLTGNLSLSDALNIVKSYKDQNDFFYELPSLITGQSPYTCGWNSYRAEVLPDGTLCPCSAMAFSDEQFRADQVTPETLKDMWQNHPLFIRLRNLKQIDFGGACCSCDYFEGCRGSCRACALGHSGDFLAGYPFCDQLVDGNQTPRFD